MHSAFSSTTNSHIPDRINVHLPAISDIYEHFLRFKICAYGVVSDSTGEERRDKS